MRVSELALATQRQLEVQPQQMHVKAPGWSNTLHPPLEQIKEGITTTIQAFQEKRECLQIWSSAKNSCFQSEVCKVPLLRVESSVGNNYVTSSEMNKKDEQITMKILICTDTVVMKSFDSLSNASSLNVYSFRVKSTQSIPKLADQNNFDTSDMKYVSRN